MAVIQVPPAVGTSGQFIDSIVITSSTNRQIVIIGDPTSTSGHAPASTGGLSVISTSVVIASGTVTATAATNPWSSAPGFNVPIVSASSGLIQISGTPTVTSTATTITSGTVTLSSAIAISSGTVTATAATNPWSSAPTFNVPIVSASSGLIQTLDSTSQGYTVYMTVTSSAGNLSTTITGAPATLKGYSIFNTNAAARFFKLFNTTSAPTLGTATPAITLLIPGSTAGAGAVQTLEKGVPFSAGLSIAITDAIGTTSTGAISAGDIAANIYYV